MRPLTGFRRRKPRLKLEDVPNSVFFCDADDWDGRYDHCSHTFHPGTVVVAFSVVADEEDICRVSSRCGKRALVDRWMGLAEAVLD